MKVRFTIMQKGKPTVINDYASAKDLPNMQIKGFEKVDVAKLMQTMFKNVQKTKRWQENEFDNKKLVIVAEPLKEDVMSLRDLIGAVSDIL